MPKMAEVKGLILFVPTERPCQLSVVHQPIFLHSLRFPSKRAVCMRAWRVGKVLFHFGR